MPKKPDGPARVRLVGLWASIVAVVAVSVTVLANNRSTGFGRVIPREEQMALLVIAMLLFVIQAIAYLISRARQASTCATVRTPSAAPSARNRP
jgi:type VI protein secretion system component VasK